MIEWTAFKLPPINLYNVHKKRDTGEETHIPSTTPLRG